MPHIRALHPLIIIRRVAPALAPTIIVVPLDTIAAAAATATTDEPEEARDEGEGDGEPDIDEYGSANVGVDLVFLERGVEGAD